MKKVIKERIPQPSLSFYNLRTNSLQNDIWTELENGLWKEYLFENRIYNNTLTEYQLHKTKPIFKNIIQIAPGFKYNRFTKNIENIKFYPQTKKMNKDLFLGICEVYFSQFKDKHIGVHLSGGLDSSIIIGLLDYLKIPFSLIGYFSTRFEFRTERKIQEKLAGYGKKTILIDVDKYPFYSKLDRFPAHQIPVEYIKDHEIQTALAKSSKELGIDILFTGMGADTILVDAISEEPNKIVWNLDEFRFPWQEDIIYSPQGVKLTSFFADKDIAEAIFNLRIGQNIDIQKKWARQYFKDFLPRELVDFSYSSDFFGLSMSGLVTAKPTIKKLLEQAYTLTEYSIFNKSEIKRLLGIDILDLDHKTYIDLMGRISIAVWINSLFN